MSQVDLKEATTPKTNAILLISLLRENLHIGSQRSLSHQRRPILILTVLFFIMVGSILCTLLFEVHNTAILRQMNNNMPMKYEPILHIFCESNFRKVVIVFTICYRYNLVLCCFILILVNCK